MNADTTGGAVCVADVQYIDYELTTASVAQSKSACIIDNQASSLKYERMNFDWLTVGKISYIRPNITRVTLRYLDAHIAAGGSTAYAYASGGPSLHHASCIMLHISYTYSHLCLSSSAMLATGASCRYGNDRNKSKSMRRWIRNSDAACSFTAGKFW